MCKTKKIKEIIDGNIEYPSIDFLTYMPSDTSYVYINSTVSVGFANMLDNKTCYQIARYSLDEQYDVSDTAKIDNNDERLKPYFQNIEDLEKISNKDWIHTKYGEFCVDDVIVVGECDYNYYYVWLDKDVSDCCITKISKKHFNSLEEFNQSVVDYFQETLGYKISKIRKPDGWISW